MIINGKERLSVAKPCWAELSYPAYATLPSARSAHSRPLSPLAGCKTRCLGTLAYASHLVCRQDEEKICRLGVVGSIAVVGHRSGRRGTQELAASMLLGTCK